MLIKTMGLLLFLVGLALIILSAMVIFDVLYMLGPIERWIAFVSGIVLSVIGYMMARTEEELAMESGESPNRMPESESTSETVEAVRPIK